MMELALRFTHAAVHVLWIGALLALAVYAIERLFVRSAAGRHAVHLIGLLLTCVVFVAVFLTASVQVAPSVSVPEKPVQERVQPPHEENAVPIAGVGNYVPLELTPPMETEPVRPNSIMPAKTAMPQEKEPIALSRWEKAAPWAAGAYLIGLFAMTLRMTVGLIGSARLRRLSDPVESELWVDALQRMTDALKRRTRPILKWSRSIAAPVLVGVVKPMILLPFALANRLTPEQVEAVLAHELAHLCRKDSWALAVQRVVETILFFHPVIWWMSHRMNIAREEACDDLVLAAGCDPADYAEALIVCSECRAEKPRFAGALATSPLAATGKGKGLLRRRVLRLIGGGDDGAVRLGRIGWVLGLLLVGGVVLALSAGKVSGNEEEELPKLSKSEIRQIEQWANAVVSGNLSEDDFLSRVGDIGPSSVRGLLPLMKNGGTDVLAMNGTEQFLDQPKVVDYLAEELRNLAEKPEYISPNTRHCCLILLGKGKAQKYVDLISRFLETSDIAAMSALAQIGGEKARDHLVGAFDVVPTDKWWLLAQELEQLGDPAAVPALKQRLAQVEAPPSERFPNATIPSMTHAIAVLSGDDDDPSISSFNQGQYFRYPYDGPGLPKTFSLNPIRDHFVRLPVVNPDSESGRAAIWKALSDATEGPGFAIDGDEVVAFHGLKLAPLWPDGPPYPTTLYDWLNRTSHQNLLKLIENAQHNGRYSIPANGLMATLDPEGKLYVLSLKKTGDNDQYDVTVMPQDPSMQLLPASDIPALTESTTCTLYDLESDKKDGALNLSRGHMETMTVEKWRLPPSDAVLVAEFAGNQAGLGIAGAKRFFMADAGEEWDDSEALSDLLINELTKQTMVPIESDGALFHLLTKQQVGHRFAFAVEMPAGHPVAGVLEIQKIDPQAETIDIRSRFFSTEIARAIFSTDKGVWGKASNGVQSRLRSEIFTWSEGETPSFLADISNQGTSDCTIVPMQEFCELLLDGVRYVWADLYP
ncbi:MAG: M56 family metallopeptidase [Pontiellaceae bacterium]|nr:M56 family metallopeptidase [Pontiellaceae bacterium]